jgi:hypothetical protein
MEPATMAVLYFITGSGIVNEGLVELKNEWLLKYQLNPQSYAVTMEYTTGTPRWL